MADKTQKWEDNAPGGFYVDKECILCSLCPDIAPANFKESDEGDHDYVFKQPENDDEIQLCRDALEQCPVEAIGEDG
ncbi:MAG: ferredoxin [Planctomycetes bacterium]|jgi:ferredoxin|nr:ferredoxin [Planctomycetota bacterium]